MSHLGLWIVDLTITQILQERVEEERRGVINGVQDSLNNSMDLLKCILVILLPDASDFGYLIILSYISISSGWLLYASFSRQQRGHLFHFCRMIPCNLQNDLAPNSHWPFFPEPDCKNPNVHYDESETPREFGNENGTQFIMASNSAKTQEETQSDRLEIIIDCNI